MKDEKPESRPKVNYTEVGNEALQSFVPTYTFSPDDLQFLHRTHNRQELADTIANEFALVILRREDYDPEQTASYVYLFINFDRIAAGEYPFLYIGSRRFNGDPMEDKYRGTNISLNSDQDAGAKIEKFILATFEDDGETGRFRGNAYELEDAILKDIGVSSAIEFYNRSENGVGYTGEELKALWADPEYRTNISKKKKELWADPEYREHMARIQTTHEYRVNISKKKKEQWADPIQRQKHIDAWHKGGDRKPMMDDPYIQDMIKRYSTPMED